MAGQPKKRRMLQLIKDKGGWQVVFDRIAAGEPMSRIAPDYEISSAFLGWYIRRTPKLLAVYEQAKTAAAAFHAEEALRVVQEAQTDPIVGTQNMTKAKLVSDQHRWMAGKLDKEFWGDDKGKQEVNLNLNIGDLHLEALRSLQKPALRVAASTQLSGDLVDSDVETIPHEEHEQPRRQLRSGNPQGR